MGFPFSPPWPSYFAMNDCSGPYADIGRKTPAHGAHIYLGQPSVFFVTVNAKDRNPWIGQAAVQSALERIWRQEATAWLVGYYLLMPDHLHLFCAPHDPHFDIDRWITFWKRQFSRAHLDRDWPWQRSAFHHRMRDRIEYEDKLAYVRENPLRKGLVRAVEAWPFQGHIHDLRWTGD
jgi:putative transposase